MPGGGQFAFEKECAGRLTPIPGAELVCDGHGGGFELWMARRRAEVGRADSGFVGVRRELMESVRWRMVSSEAAGAWLAGLWMAGVELELERLAGKGKDE